MNRIPRDNFEGATLQAIAAQMGNANVVLGAPPVDTSGNHHFKAKKAKRKQAKQARRRNRR